MLRAVLPHTARQFARAIVMPNLKPPVTTVDAAGLSRAHPRGLPPGQDFTPLMTLLPDRRRHDARRVAPGLRRRASFAAAKLYPAGATTQFGESA